MTILLEFINEWNATLEEHLQSTRNNEPLKTVAKNSFDTLDKQYKLLDKVKDHSYINKSNRNDVLFAAKKIEKFALRYRERWLISQKIQNKKLNAIPSCWIKEDYKAAKRMVQYMDKQSTFFKDVSKEMKAIQVTCLNLK
jgi:hypothetical protein